MIIEKVLTTPEGRTSLNIFKEVTTNNIRKNIEYLKEKDLLVKEIYGDTSPMGIFAVINKSEDYLFQHRIGAVGLDKFVYHDKDLWSSYSRICVSVQHELFKKYLINIK
jgi:aspartate aminotransferase